MISPKIRDFATTIGFIVLLCFAIYANIIHIVRNNDLAERVIVERAKVEQLTKKLETTRLLLSYYQTADFQEKEARQRLGYMREGETAYVIKGTTTDTLTAQLLHGQLEKLDNAQTLALSEQPNWRKWLDYILGRY